MKRTNISTGTPWEPIIGYSRAVRVGDMVSVSGTTATGPRRQDRRRGQSLSTDGADAQEYRQRTRTSGCALRRCVRTRNDTTQISAWEQIGRAHGEVFGIRPATAMIQVSGLVNSEMLVEIEAEAIVTKAPASFRDSARGAKAKAKPRGKSRR